MKRESLGPQIGCPRPVGMRGSGQKSFGLEPAACPVWLPSPNLNACSGTAHSLAPVELCFTAFRGRDRDVCSIGGGRGRV